MADFMKRMAVIAEIARRQPGLGRTAMMKYLYLLQTLRRVPLGYRFELYLYGPYTTDVLDDIASAELWGLLQEEVTEYGYRILPHGSTDGLPQEAKSFAEKYFKEIEWVVSKFSRFSAAELELIGTLFWVYDHGCQEGTLYDEHRLIEVALRLKPHFTEQTALEIVRYLKELGVFDNNQCDR